jgi:DNA-binding NarL/FixJ family response regulator
MAAKPISVFACESQPVVVEGLRKALEQNGEFEFVGAAPRPSDALEALRGVVPDVALMDHDDGPVAALELAAELAGVLPGTHPVLWVKSLDDISPSMAMGAGVRGILAKNRPLETLLECLREVARGNLWFEPDTGAPAADGERQRRRPPRLTPRERQVLTLLAQGMKNTEIATALAISPGTVKVHLMHVFEKTGAHDRYELAIRSRKLLGADAGGDGRSAADRLAS